MAGVDYYHCDVCGYKAFYDAELRKNQAMFYLMEHLIMKIMEYQEIGFNMAMKQPPKPHQR